MRDSPSLAEVLAMARANGEQPFDLEFQLGNSWTDRSAAAFDRGAS